ncbi:MAG TPA: riboflavin biosynthesis protein RibF, partial [Stellaceae bacterium]|nr:riboflavin biosynthesis protein RibF [Stellaceae bacterium]
VDLLLVLPFDLEFSKVAADEFVRTLIVESLKACHAVVGYDFHFGHKRGGTPDVLRQLGERWGFGVSVVAPLEAAGGTVYSSTRIRQDLAQGRAREAAALLGRPFEIEGRVEMGDQRGRTIDFPTANLRLGDYLRPAGGVYAVRVLVEEEAPPRWRDGVANLGTRPTVGGTDLRLEAHLFDFAGDLYGKHIQVALVEHLRPERKFAGLDELKAQIAADAAQARAILAEERNALG